MRIWLTEFAALVSFIDMARLKPATSAANIARSERYRVPDAGLGVSFGTFWRFLIADDREVERYLVRDCDACVNPRERAAVEDWIASGRHFHVMRDALTHTELMLAGMWGGVRGALPSIKREMIDFSLNAQLSRTADQTFLRERIWPTVRQSVLIHDSQFRFGGSVDFPARADIPGLEVGRAVQGRKQS